jgi:hypothetical protein
MTQEITYFKTTTENLGSDHFAIEFGIKTGMRKKQAAKGAQPAPKYNWENVGAKEKYAQHVKKPLERWTEEWGDETKWRDQKGKACKAKIEMATEEISKILTTSAEETAQDRKRPNNKMTTNEKIEDWEIRLKEATKERRQRLKEMLQEERKNKDVTHLRNRFLKAKAVVERILDHRKKNKNRKTWESVEQKYDARPGENFWKDIKAAVDPPS